MSKAMEQALRNLCDAVDDFSVYLLTERGQIITEGLADATAKARAALSTPGDAPEAVAQPVVHKIYDDLYTLANRLRDDCEGNKAAALFAACSELKRLYAATQDAQAQQGERG